jgi:hypothetical protein
MRSTRIPFVFLLILTAVSAFAQSTFSVVNSGLETTFSNSGKGVLEPQVAGISGVAFGAGLFVVIANSTGEDAIRWATSPDGTTWTARSQAVGGGMKTYANSRVHFLNGKFMFFAAHTTTSAASTWVYTSADGLTWTQSKVADSRLGFEEFDASPTLTVVGGSNGGQVASSDLVTWTSRPVVLSGSGYDHLDVSYGNGRFFSSINGFGGTTYTSTDGAAWTSIASATIPGGSRVESGNGLVIINAGADYYRSTDGNVFTKVTPTIPTGWLAIGPVNRFTGGRFLSTASQIVGSSFLTGYLGSTDGLSFSAVGYLPATPAAAAGTSRLWVYSDIAFGNGKYVQTGVEIVQTLFTKVTGPLIMTLDATAASTPPTIGTQPVAQTISTGGTAIFSVTASGATSYQWKLNGTSIAGATGTTLVVRHATAANAGSYTVDAISSAGTTTSAAAVLTLSATADYGRISNLSILTTVTTAEPSFTVGIVVGGGSPGATKPLLVRAAGPSLEPLGVTGVLADPKMDVFVGQNVVDSSDNWGGDATLASAFTAVGAFAYASASSKDAATFSPAAEATSYTVQVTGVGGSAGAVIAEVYDGTPVGSFTASTPRLINVSVLKGIPAGSILTAGFVIGGSTAKTVLVRAIGPRLALAPFGIGGTLADPKLDLFSGQTLIASNDNWGGDPQLTAVGDAVGAFAVTDAASKDAMLALTLAPGSYTAQVSGVNNTGGLAIVEIYEVP